MENKRQVQHLVSKSKSIVRLKPRNPDEKSSSPIIVKALCDFKQDQKVILKDNEGILKDNSQRSKWHVTGPGGLDMLVPSVCLMIPPPNPISISLANKNEQYYEAIMSIWNQLYINVKSLIAWQYCLLDIKRINSLTMTMLSKMSQEEYRQIIRSMETHYEEFKKTSKGSQMFAEEDRKVIENQFTGAQAHYDKLVVQLPSYGQCYVSAFTYTHVCLLDICLINLKIITALKSNNLVGLKRMSYSAFLTIFTLTFPQMVQRDVDLMRDEYLRLRDRILRELETISDSDKAQFLRSEIGLCKIALFSPSFFFFSIRALRDLLQSLARAEDTVKVYEARLTEKETTSLQPSEVQHYMTTLEVFYIYMSELDQKRDVLAAMEAELTKATHWNCQVGGPFHRCDMMLSKYTEQVSLLSDRWKRIQGQIDTRIQDLEVYLPQLQHYQQVSTSLSDWIDITRKKQDALQATKIESVQALKTHISNQKALNSEIKSRRETLDGVLRDNEACVNSIKDYETDLASYSSGLETLLNIPIKRTMLKSPSVDLNQEATHLQTRYMELLTLSGDYNKFLGDLLKNMEELKIRNTRIDLLEEELRLLKDDLDDRNTKNKSLEDAVSRYQLELSQAQEQLLSVEDVKQKTVLQCSATKESLDSTQSQLSDLNDEVTRLNYLLEEEKRKKRLAEERYTQQQEEYEGVLRKRQKELETVSRSKMEIEKSVANKDHEIEQLQRQLEEEAARIKELQKEMSKVRSQCSAEINNLKLSYDSQIHISQTDIQRLAAQRDEDTAELQMQYDRMEAERRNLEDEVRRLRTSINQVEEQRQRAEEEAHSQRLVITEEGRRRRELESQVEMLMRQMDEESSQYREDLAEIMNSLQEKSDQLAYTTHSLDEEIRRRKTIEEGQGVLGETITQMQQKLTSSSVVATQLKESEDELEKMRFEFERENKERSRVEQNMSRLQGRLKDLQVVRDALESQVENLRKSNQEEAARRRQVEAELEKAAVTLTEYTTTLNVLRQSESQAKERLRLTRELENSVKQNKTTSERVIQLSTELKALQQQLVQLETHVKEVNLRNEGLSRTIEEKSKALNDNCAGLQRLKETIETQTKERLKLEEELRAARHEKEELKRAKQGSDAQFSSQITALEVQLQASERSNVDFRNLVSEISSEREKLKVETKIIQKQATEVHGTLVKSLQSQYNDIVSERDALLKKLHISEKDKSRMQRLEEDLAHMKLSLDSELRNKQRLQEDHDRVKRDVSYWKDQHDSKQSVMRQYDSDKERLEREKNSLKSEVERLMRELRELEDTYKSRLSTLQKEVKEVTVVRQTMETELKKAREPPTLDPNTLIFDGVRKPVTAKDLLDCDVLDKPTFNQLVKGNKTVPEVSVDKKVNLKGTGPIAGVVIESPKGPRSIKEPLNKMTFTEAKKANLLPPDSVDLLLDAQAATGHIIDPRTNQKLTVEEACNQGVVDDEDKERLLAAEAAAIGYGGPGRSKPLSVFQAMRKGLIDKNTTLRLLQAQESVGGILDPILSVFLPKNTAIERDLINDDIYRALNQRPELYLDPESEEGTTYMAMKRRCKVDPHTGLLLLPVPEKLDPSKLIFEGVRKPVTHKQLLDCGVLDKPTFKDLEKGKKSVPEVSADKIVNLKGTGPIAGVIAGNRGKLSLSEAKKQMLLPADSADLLLEAQAATGHIIDPRTNQKLIVEEACAKGLVDITDRDKLLAAEAAAVGYKDPTSAKPLSVFDAMKKGQIDNNTGLRLLQAQESVGGILDPNLSVFLPHDTAIKRNLLDENTRHALNQCPECYIDPETEQDVTYDNLKKRCKTEPHTGLLLLPVTEKLDPSELIFEGVRKPVTSKQLLDCGVLDKPTFKDLEKGKKSVPEVAIDKKVSLKGTGPIAGVIAGNQDKILLAGQIDNKTGLRLLQAQESVGGILDPNLSVFLPHDTAIKRNLLDKMTQRALNQNPECYIDPETEQEGKKSVPEVSVDKKVNLKGTGPVAGVIAGNKGKMSLSEAKKQMLLPSDIADLLLDAQAATGHIIDPTTNKKLTVEEACKGKIDNNTGLRLLQAQESVGGILDPNLSVFLPHDTAIKRKLLDDDTQHALNQCPECYIDPETEQDVTYDNLKKRCKTEPHTGLLLLP
uniref:Desmoplakin b n=1 Tax=Sphaeramia orbicularis TaxID=375764 RepID=A0A672YY88_9TELE